MNNKSMLVIGASRGLGEAIALGVPNPGDHVWCVSRTKPNYLDRTDGISRQWIMADLSRESGALTVKEAIGHKPINALIYIAGIWETAPFDIVTDSEIHSIINTNLSSLLLCVKHLQHNIISANAPKLILIGSTCGLDNEGSSSPAYVSSKFGVRGAAHAFRERFRKSGVGVTCISPGSIATDIDYDSGVESALRKHKGERIPMQDLVNLIRYINSVSSATCVKEIHIPAMYDIDV